jgi:hypothetical protein
MNVWTLGTDLTDAERTARCRAFARVGAGMGAPAPGHDHRTQAAETDTAAFPLALRLLDQMPALRRRQLLALYAELARGAARQTCEPQSPLS